MNESIQQSRDHALRNTGWIVDEDSFRVLSEGQTAWVTRVTTTHLQARGEQEVSFYVLASMSQCITLDAEGLAQLGIYIQERT